MTPDRFQRVMELFQEACDLPARDRAAFLDDRCADDPSLRTEIEALLEHDRDKTRVLAVDEIGGGARLLAAEIARTTGTPLEGAPEPALIPELIGRYRVVRKIGEGGMGAVYEAEQESPRRTVAIKVIRSERASRSLLRRFEHEAELLGRLQHPGIAQIFEAGAAEIAGGRRIMFLAMEFVRGLPLTEYANSKRFGMNARLELLARVCEAVQHAHQKGIIHRDLKPANILVVDEPHPAGATDYGVTGAAHAASGSSATRRLTPDSIGQPKILDFGVARVIDSDGQLTTMRTTIGQLVGTLPYMSPEQVAGDPDAVDTRSDVYALGVLLFELLTARLPHDVQSCSLPEAARKIRFEEPSRLGSLNRTLRGEIETIVTKALEKEKSRRYQSAADLAADIRRHLEGEPIEAKRDSALYVLRKQLRRYRGVFAAGVLASSALAVFAVMATWQAEINRDLAAAEQFAKDEALAQRDLAERERRRAEAALAESNVERGRLFARTGNVGAAEDLIWRQHLTHPDSRQTFWALWELYAQHPCIRMFQADEGDCRTARYSIDGARLFTGGEDRTVRVWDVRSGRRLSTLNGHARTVTRVCPHPDGRTLISGDENGQVIVWDLPSAAPRRQIAAHDGACRALCLSVDGRRIVTGGADRRIRFWDLETGALLSDVHAHPSEVASVIFAPGGGLLATAGAEGFIRLWRAPYVSPFATLTGHQGSVGPLAITPDGNTLISGGSDRTIRLWDLELLQQSEVLSAPNGTVRSLSLSEDGKTLISGGWWRIDEWDLRSRTLRRSYPIHEGVMSTDISRDGRYMVGTFQRYARIWELSPHRDLLEIRGFTGRTAVTISPDGRHVAVGDQAGALRLHDRTSGKLVQELAGHGGRIRALKFDPGGRILATGGDDGLLKVWDLTTGETLYCLTGFRDATTDSLSISPDGRNLIGAFDWTYIRMFDLYSGELLFESQATDPNRPPILREVLSVRFSPRGDVISTTARDQQIKLWSLDGKLLRTIQAPNAPWTSVFTPDQRFIAAGTWGKTVEVYDAESGRLHARLEGHNGLVGTVEFRPNTPDMLASSGADGTLRLWDIQARQCLLTLDRFDGWDALSVSFDISGNVLASSSADGRVGIWNLRYYDRHIAGNLEAQIDRLAPDLKSSLRANPLRRWADEVLSRP